MPYTAYLATKTYLNIKILHVTYVVYCSKCSYSLLRLTDLQFRCPQIRLHIRESSTITAKNISLYHESEGVIEKSVPRITF